MEPEVNNHSYCHLPRSQITRGYRLYGGVPAPTKKLKSFKASTTGQCAVLGIGEGQRKSQTNELEYLAIFLASLKGRKQELLHSDYGATADEHNIKAEVLLEI